MALINRVVNCILHRWVLRSVIHSVDPDLVRYDPELSLHFLRHWLEARFELQQQPPGASPIPLSHEVMVQMVGATFDLGEYFLFGGDFSSAESYLKQAKQLYSNDSFKDCKRYVLY